MTLAAISAKAMGAERPKDRYPLENGGVAFKISLTDSVLGASADNVSLLKPVQARKMLMQEAQAQDIPKGKKHVLLKEDSNQDPLPHVC